MCGATCLADIQTRVTSKTKSFEFGVWSSEIKIIILPTNYSKLFRRIDESGKEDSNSHRKTGFGRT